MGEEEKKAVEQPEEGKEVAKKETTEVATINKDDLGFGGDEAKELLIIPRAKLLQGSSPEMKDSNLECRVGDIINSLTKEKLPEFFVPILFTTNWVRFNAKTAEEPGFDPNFEPGAIIWRAVSKTDPAYIDAECQFGANGEKPLAVQFLNFLSYFPGSPMPIIVSFAKTSFRAGKELFSLCKAMPGAPYAYKYRLGSQTKTGPTGDDFLLLTVNMAGKNEGESYERAHDLALQFKAKVDQIVPHEEETAAETEGEEIPF